MRKLYVLFFPMVLLFFKQSYSQTVLSIGDIAFTGYNSDGTDDFSFIILKTGGISSGTQIRFTNYGWSSGACGTNGWGSSVEEEVLWTASSALAYGTQIRINGLTASTGTVSGTAMNLSSAGDQLFAIQGVRTGVYTMIAGIHMNEEPGNTSATNWDNITTPTGTQSNRPTCLTNGTYALFINPEVDNARLKATVALTNNPATDRAIINNAANWDTDEITPFPLPVVFGTLPVKFTYIRAFHQNSNTKIEWGIAEEQNVKSYTVEQSVDGRIFNTAATVTSTGLQNYSYTDPNTNTAFYRIRSNDIDGKALYSSIVRLSVKQASAIVIASYKNKVLDIRLDQVPEGKFSLFVYSNSGNLVMVKDIIHRGTSAGYQTALSLFPITGIYIIVLGNEKFKATNKIFLE